MRILKNILSQLHVYTVWLILGFVLWGFVFGLVTDAPPAKKIVLFADVESCRDLEMAAALDEARSPGIRMIQVHPFSYTLFDDAQLLNADLFIVRAADAEDYSDSFRPLDAALLREKEFPLYELEGGLSGILVWDGETGCAASFLDYAPEAYVLFAGANSPHAEDGTLPPVIDALLRLP